jgi:hypothetical protein
VLDFAERLENDPKLLMRAISNATSPGYPAARGPREESELLYEALFRREEWRVLEDQPALLPREWFNSRDRTCIKEAFLDQLQREIAGILGHRGPTPLLASPSKALPPDSPARVIWVPLRALFGRLRKEGVAGVTEYRILLLARWLVGQLDLHDAVDDRIASKKALLAKKRLGRIRKRCKELVDLLGLQDWPASNPPQDEIPPGELYSNQGLPDLVLAWPASLKRLARALLAIPAADLDTKTQREIYRLLVTGEDRPESGYPISVQARYEQMAAGNFKASASQRIDPAASLAALVLSKILAADPRTRPDRVRVIADFLNAAYPLGYRTPHSRLGARRPTGLWNRRTIERWIYRG